MIVVADSSPLRYLVLIREIELLPVLYGKIILPPSVVRELTQNTTPRPVRIWMEHLPEWVTVVSPRLPLTVFPVALDPGEREAIALAVELSADLLLADDGAARMEAARRKIPVQGTLGILDLAAEHGHVDFSKALGKLTGTNFRAGTKLIQFFLDRDAQRKR
ncbi:MAG: hypothetical protein ABSB30_11070 [Terracidiphilus sp.]|jgi:predicted nucleic acid-binding protein